MERKLWLGKVINLVLILGILVCLEVSAALAATCEQIDLWLSSGSAGPSGYTISITAPCDGVVNLSSYGDNNMTFVDKVGGGQQWLLLCDDEAVRVYCGDASKCCGRPSISDNQALICDRDNNLVAVVPRENSLYCPPIGSYKHPIGVKAGDKITMIQSSSGNWGRMTFTPSVPQCQDGVDNDNDGLVDLNDYGCSSIEDNNESDGTSQCQDDVDNDVDGVMDASDPGCWTDTNNSATYDRALNNEERATTQCQDGVDNDTDGAVDYPLDYSCSTKIDMDEGNPKSQCQDGVDNDNDGLTDLLDQGCSSAQDSLEGDAATQCSDGIDNDGDGLIDFAGPAMQINQSYVGLAARSSTSVNAAPLMDISNATIVQISNITSTADLGFAAAKKFSCSVGYLDGGILRNYLGVFLNASDQIISSYLITEFQTGINVPIGAAKIGFYLPDDPYTDNAGSCSFDVTVSKTDYSRRDPGCFSPSDTLEVVTQCSDGIDNDGDTLTDAVINVDPNSNHDYVLGRKGTTSKGQPIGEPGLVRSMVNARQPLFGYIRISESASALSGDDVTALKVCQIAGYRELVSWDCRSTWGAGCIWDSPYNNYLHKWNGSNFEAIGNPSGRKWISLITCRGKLSSCNDGVDNDGDGKRDFPEDTGCASADDDSEASHDLGCTDVTDNSEGAQCEDGIDNDGDGLVDMDDPGCTSNLDNFEGDGTSECQDDIDNDGDGYVDYPADFSCSSPQDIDETNPKSQCQDGVDNDFDGLTDLTDPGCSTAQDNFEGDGTSQCQDGVDNDGDGATDYPADFSCSSKTDLDETSPKSQCQDGVDNDNDGLTDLADPGCSTAQDNFEGDGTSQCQDGVDNDGDGAADYPADFSCSSKTDTDETNPKSPCQDGLDNDNDGLTDLADPGCSSAQDTNEGDGTSQCQDGVDNDGDGATDYPADFSCSSPQDKDETNPRAQCQDGIDNDNDGFIDMQDRSCKSSQGNDEGAIDTSKPDAPANLSASDGASPDYVLITWLPAYNAQSYILYRSQFAGELGQQLNGELSGTSYEDRTAVPGVRYYYTAKAKNQWGESGLSNTDSGFRKDINNENDSDGDGVSDDQEVIDGTDPSDPGSFQLHLKSPAFTKFNTYIRQWNFLELIASGTKAINAKVTVYLLDGQELTSKSFAISPQAEVDVDINSMIREACIFSSSNCAQFSDLDGNGVIDTYGVVRIDFNNKLAGETMLGRLSNYRQELDGKSYSFAFTKELRNPTRGTTYATANTYDPQGLGYLVPNWVEIINLDNKVQEFDYRLYNQAGRQVFSKTVALLPLAERDIQGGHEVVSTDGKLVEDVYLAEIAPRDGAVPYFSTVSRYSSNSPAGVDPSSYNYGFAIDGRAGSGASQYMSITNEVGTCYSQSNWIEVVNVREKTVTAALRFRASNGAILSGGDIFAAISSKSQYHFNAGALLAKGQIGSVELASSDPASLIAQSLVYYHDCKENKLQTAYVSQARSAGRDVQAGSLNTFLEMSNALRIIATGDANTVITGELRTFDAISSPMMMDFELSAYGVNQISSSNGSLSIASEKYGALALRTLEPLKFTADVLRIRGLSGGGIDFVMPTVVQ